MNNLVRILAVGTLVALPLHAMAAPSAPNTAAKTGGAAVIGNIGGTGVVGASNGGPAKGGTGTRISPKTGGQPVSTAPTSSKQGGKSLAAAIGSHTAMLNSMDRKGNNDGYVTHKEKRAWWRARNQK